ncbi:MAG: hypothetical protein ACREMB_05025 [Candidatus Rokuibacteriota bacterium]
MRSRPAALALALTALLPGLAAGEDGAVPLDLSMRARVLGIVPGPYGGARSEAEALGLETMRAPTGAGTTRMPFAVSGGKPGVYVGVAVCEPFGERRYLMAVDGDWSLPEGAPRGVPGPRGLTLPGRP